MRGLLVRVLFIGLGLAFLAASFWSLRFFGRYQPFADLTASSMSGLSAPGLDVSDAVITGRQDGKRRWRIAARHLAVSRDRRTISVEGISEARLFDAQERPVLSARAGQAIYSVPVFANIAGLSTNLHLTGGIQARALKPPGMTLVASGLLWNLTLNQMTTEGQVTAQLPRLSLVAGRAIYNAPSGVALDPGHPDALARGTLALDNGVRASVQSRGGPASFSTTGLVWDAGQGQAHSLGPVSARLPGSFGAVSASDAQVDTRTGNLSLRRVHGVFQVGAIAP